MKAKHFDNYINTDSVCLKLTLRKQWILDTHGWRTSKNITCYCPSCSNGSKRSESRNWKTYRKKQYKTMNC